MEPFPFTPNEFAAFWLAPAIVTLGAFVLLRRRARLPFFQPKFSGGEVHQNWTSGASSRGLVGNLVWASNALWFVLAADTLHVGAHFPFNVFFPRFFAQLDLAIPVRTMSSVVEKTSWHKGDFLRIEYEVMEEAGGVVRTEHVDLVVRDRDRFASILREKARVARAR